MADAGEQVCPRCGSPAGGEAFCTECGYDLRAHGELPTREEWVKGRTEEGAQPAQPEPRPQAAPPAPPAGGGAPEFWRSTWFAVVVLVVGVVLGAFGIIRIAGGDSEVSRLEDDLDSLQAQQSELESQTAAVQDAAAATDTSITEFIDSVEAAADSWQAMRNETKPLVAGLESAQSAGQLKSAARTYQRDVKAAAGKLGKAVKEAEQSLSAARESVSTLQSAVDSASGSSAGDSSGESAGGDTTTTGES